MTNLDVVTNIDTVTRIDVFYVFWYFEAWNSSSFVYAFFISRHNFFFIDVAQKWINKKNAEFYHILNQNVRIPVKKNDGRASQ